MKTIALLGLVGLVYGQREACVYSGGPNGVYTLNLTTINGYHLEYKSTSGNQPHNYYYTPCRNGEPCQQGTATFYGNTVQYVSGNQCNHFLSVDHHEPPNYYFGGATWTFRYNDGQLCDQTQQPRQVTIYYQCDELMPSGAYLYDVDEPDVCRYNFVVRSPLACIPEDDKNANCQWQLNYQNETVYLDLSSQKGSYIRDHMTQNGYQHYYTPCQNGLHCYQQSGPDIQVQSIVENDITHTCEHYLSVWQEGRVYPTFHKHDDPTQTHWSFHYWLSQSCSTNGLQGEETIRWYCDPSVANSTLINATYDGDCRWEMNIASSLACPDNAMYHKFDKIYEKYKLKY